MFVNQPRLLKLQPLFSACISKFHHSLYLITYIKQSVEPRKGVLVQWNLGEPKQCVLPPRFCVKKKKKKKKEKEKKSPGEELHGDAIN